MSWLVTNRLPQFLADVQPRRAAELAKVRAHVTERLSSERDRLYLEAAVASEKERAGGKAKESSDNLTRKAQDLETRLTQRLAKLEKRECAGTQASPRCCRGPSAATVGESRPSRAGRSLRHAVDTLTVERRAVEAVLAHETLLGRLPQEQARNNKGFDILSTLPDGGALLIEVKGRIEGSDDFYISHNEVLTGKNAAPKYRLALVRVDQRAAFDEVRYLDDPFATTEFGDFDATGLRGDWAKMWARGRKPLLGMSVQGGTLLACWRTRRRPAGERSRARVALAADLLGFDGFVIENLFAISSHATGAIATLGATADGWLKARPALLASLADAAGVLFAYGTSEPVGPARTQFRDQVAWLDAVVVESGLPAWQVGDGARHPSRWQRWTSRAHPDLCFIEAPDATLRVVYSPACQLPTNNSEDAA